jgi:hypothetical protein
LHRPVEAASYNGNITTFYDESRKQWQRTTDALGRLTNVTEDPAGLNLPTSYVPIPGPGMQVHPHCEYVDREAPALPASEWLIDLIHAGSGGQRTSRLLACRPLPNTALCVLLSFQRRGDRWFCDFYESSGIAKVRKTLAYRSSDKVVSLAIRGGAMMDGITDPVSTKESKSVTVASC